MIEFDQVGVAAGAFQLREISFRVPTGAHAALMGRTGSGKTTLLEALCGLRRVTAGSIRIHGQDVTRLSPGERGLGFVPQDGALFRHLSVRQHLAFAPAIRAWPPDRTRRRVEELAAWLGLGPILDRLPHGLSGGETQRVALGRALAAEPRVLCLDEPLSALDDDSRAEVADVLADVRRRTGVTILHVTHNLAEARRLADRVLVLKDGRITTPPHRTGRDAETDARPGAGP